jgi:hypothetical protein
VAISRGTRGKSSVFVKDYSAAIARAIAQLGDRYLLAKPIRSASKAMPPQANVRANHIDTELIGGLDRR